MQYLFRRWRSQRWVGSLQARPFGSSVVVLTSMQAFESPLLADCNSNSSGGDIARKAGETPIRYGVIASEDQTKAGVKLAFADPAVVEKPRSGMLIDI